MARNIAQAMGGWNVLAWGWPLARSTRVEEGLSFEHNWIEDPSKAWPPPDPDRMFRAAPQPVPQEGFDAGVLDVQAFKARQEADLSRRYNDAEGEFVVRRKPFWQRLEEMQAKENGYDSNGRKVYEVEDEGNVAVGSDSEGGYGDDEDEDEDDVFRPRKEDDVGEEAWRNEEGERLADFGVDEVAEFYDEDDLPLGEILRRRKRLAKG